MTESYRIDKKTLDPLLHKTVTLTKTDGTIIENGYIKNIDEEFVYIFWGPKRRPFLDILRFWEIVRIKEGRP